MSLGKEVCANAFYFFALVNQGDPAHPKATALAGDHHFEHTGFVVETARVRSGEGGRNRFELMGA